VSESKSEKLEETLITTGFCSLTTCIDIEVELGVLFAIVVTLKLLETHQIFNKIDVSVHLEAEDNCLSLI